MIAIMKMPHSGVNMDNIIPQSLLMVQGVNTHSSLALIQITCLRGALPVRHVMQRQGFSFKWHAGHKACKSDSACALHEAAYNMLTMTFGTYIFH